MKLYEEYSSLSKRNVFTKEMSEYLRENLNQNLID